MIKWYVDPSPFPPHTHILNAASHPQFCCQCVSQCRMIWVTGHTGHGQNVSMCSWLIIDGGNSVVSVLFVGKLLPVSSWPSASLMDEPLMPCQHCSPSICISCANSTLTVLCVRERDGGEQDLWFCMFVVNLCLFSRWGGWVIQVFRAYYCCGDLGHWIQPFYWRQSFVQIS